MIPVKDWQLETLESQKAALTRGPLSPSQVTTYLDCAARWYFGSALGLPNPPNGGLALGSAFHAAIAADLRARQLGADEASQTDITEEFEKAFTGEIESAELAPDEDAAQLRSKGAEMAWLFHRSSKSIKAAAIEKPVSGRIGTGQARGIIDLITEDGRVIDIKTAAKKPSGVSAAHKLQLTTYGILEHRTEAAVITITKCETPELVIHPFRITPDQTAHTVTMYSLVAESIETGLHIPNRGSNFCSRKHCAFWRACESEFGGKVKE